MQVTQLTYRNVSVISCNFLHLRMQACRANSVKENPDRLIGVIYELKHSQHMLTNMPVSMSISLHLCYQACR